MLVGTFPGTYPLIRMAEMGEASCWCLGRSDQSTGSKKIPTRAGLLPLASTSVFQRAAHRAFYISPLSKQSRAAVQACQQTPHEPQLVRAGMCPGITGT